MLQPKETVDGLEREGPGTGPLQETAGSLAASANVPRLQAQAKRMPHTICGFSNRSQCPLCHRGYERTVERAPSTSCTRRTANPAFWHPRDACRGHCRLNPPLPLPQTARPHSAPRKRKQAEATYRLDVRAESGNEQALLWRLPLYRQRIFHRERRRLS